MCVLVFFCFTEEGLAMMCCNCRFSYVLRYFFLFRCTEEKLEGMLLLLLSVIYLFIYWCTEELLEKMCCYILFLFCVLLFYAAQRKRYEKSYKEELQFPSVCVSCRLYISYIRPKQKWCNRPQTVILLIHVCAVMIWIRMWKNDEKKSKNIETSMLNLNILINLNQACAYKYRT